MGDNRTREIPGSNPGGGIFLKMPDDKIDLTKEYEMSKEVISKLGHLLARGFVDLDWIIEQAKENAKQQAREIKRKKVPVKKS